MVISLIALNKLPPGVRAGVVCLYMFLFRVYPSSHTVTVEGSSTMTQKSSGGKDDEWLDERMSLSY